jgi:hypothetical protein
MLEELFNLVKNVADLNPESSSYVPAGQKEAVVAEATNTVAAGLRNIVAGGGLISYHYLASVPATVNNLVVDY